MKLDVEIVDKGSFPPIHICAGDSFALHVDDKIVHRAVFTSHRTITHWMCFKWGNNIAYAVGDASLHEGKEEGLSNG